MATIIASPAREQPTAIAATWLSDFFVGVVCGGVGDGDVVGGDVVGGLHFSTAEQNKTAKYSYKKHS